MSESGDEKVFPLLNRQTPVLNRVRNMRGGNKRGSDTGKAFAAALLADNESEKTEIASEFGENMRASMARELGVGVEDVRTDLPAEFQHIILELRPEDVLTQESLEDQGIGTTPQDGEEALTEQGGEEPGSLESEDGDAEDSEESDEETEF